MARPSQEAIDTFMAVTGASESLALQKLEEHGGNLDEAINGHFGEVDTHNANANYATSAAFQQHHQIRDGSRGLSPLLAAVRSFKPSLLLDPNYRRDLYKRIGASAFNSRGPFISHSGQVGELPQRFNSGNEQPYHLGPRQTDDVSGVSLSSGQGTHGNHIEEEMIQAAIEASKKDFERGYQNQQFSAPSDSSSIGLPQGQIHTEDDFSRAISLSLETAEQEKAMREQQVINEDQDIGYYDLGVRNEKAKNSGLKVMPGSSSSCHSGAARMKQPLVSPGSNCNTTNSGNRPPHSKDGFYSEEWGEISPKELDEAVMLESALFREIPEELKNRFHDAPHLQSNQGKIFSPHSGMHPPSASLTAQRFLREQQDVEYMASLMADRGKEINALKEADSHSLKKEIMEDLERSLAIKEALLPQEPAADDENIVTLLVRMPDGSRYGRRFLKSDKLQLLFDFIDVGRVVKSGTYRVVRPYPRHAFSFSDSSLSLSELGLTSKQEALFLELI
ncbi:plant UBX domain-containing protein 9 [Juglans microcarpa x Juglans regia]|uniref:plant UBX domain-containing protein 9 n=1 Tax=Juglans microcarpa x Juglans regia TaxID=2249226 RepID=UPI001B7E7D74|nr:plant UBX domain-containing protein 9 [Juglans microcarpa x Juglans regia]